MSPSTSHRATVQRLTRKWSVTTPRQRRRGRNWYTLERAWIERQIAALAPDLPLRHGPSIYAALSPQMPWERNRKLVRAVLRGDSYPGGCFPRSWERATDAVLYGPLALGGPKVTAFDCNLAGCTECVTVDVHMYHIAGWPITGNYEMVADCYRTAAQRVGVAPAHFQATLWLALRPERPKDPDERHA